MKRFSVLLPTRNRLDLLKYAVETVRGQDFSDWELIVSDNCSSDDVAGYVTSLGDSRIVYGRTESFVSVTENWNRALERSSGEHLIMLGDDDGLVRGALLELDRLIREFKDPDFIFTDTLQFVYPGVFPGQTGPFIQRGYAAFFDGSIKSPQFMDRATARELVERSFDFRLPFVYNMQQSIVSRKLVEQLAAAGSFFQSPYPDYYATNAIFLNARRILINPTPLLAIGVSPKSFGFYYFNKREVDGNSFLNNEMDPVLKKTLGKVILPGSEMNNSWLGSMETLRARYGAEYGVRVNYRRYRLLQLLDWYQEDRGVAQPLSLLTATERLLLLGFQRAASYLHHILSARQWQSLQGEFRKWMSTYPSYDSQLETVDAQHMLDVFRLVDFKDQKYLRRPSFQIEKSPSAFSIGKKVGAALFMDFLRCGKGAAKSAYLKHRGETRIEALAPYDWQPVQELQVRVKMSGVVVPIEANLYRLEKPTERVTGFSLSKVSGRIYQGVLRERIATGPYIVRIVQTEGKQFAEFGCNISDSSKA